MGPGAAQEGPCPENELELDSKGSAGVLSNLEVMETLTLPTPPPAIIPLSPSTAGCRFSFTIERWSRRGVLLLCYCPPPYNRNFGPLGSIRKTVLPFSPDPVLPSLLWPQSLGRKPVLIGDFRGKVLVGAQASPYLALSFGAGSPQVTCTTRSHFLVRGDPTTQALPPEPEGAGF